MSSAGLGFGDYRRRVTPRGGADRVAGVPFGAAVRALLVAGMSHRRSGIGGERSGPAWRPGRRDMPGTDSATGVWAVASRTAKGAQIWVVVVALIIVGIILAIALM
ncbi:hypothetical protein GCM10023322_82080 [Rugosimonospora acidiphila]|uniref:Uncharacterized protein n=1 Tax=Rugosimonospora acidiphila TaxID=556531 RepID=A0ABP9SVV2_9ACTN